MIEIRVLKKEDRESLHKILKECAVFTEKEIKVALELIDLCLAGSPDYIVEVLKEEDKIIGYVCYGENPITSGIWDLYWICVSPEYHGKGYGEMLLKKVENSVKEKGGRSLFIETSSLESYERARKFYEKNGFKIVCIINDFYKIGDHKIIYRKDF